MLCTTIEETNSDKKWMTKLQYCQNKEIIQVGKRAENLITA